MAFRSSTSTTHRTFKPTMTPEDGRRKREESRIELRKTQNDKIMNKRRRLHEEKEENNDDEKLGVSSRGLHDSVKCLAFPNIPELHNLKLQQRTRDDTKSSIKTLLDYLASVTGTQVDAMNAKYATAVGALKKGDPSQIVAAVPAFASLSAVQRFEIVSALRQMTFVSTDDEETAIYDDMIRSGILGYVLFMLLLQQVTSKQNNGNASSSSPSSSSSSSSSSSPHDRKQLQSQTTTAEGRDALAGLQEECSWLLTNLMYVDMQLFDVLNDHYSARDLLMFMFLEAGDNMVLMTQCLWGITNSVNDVASSRDIVLHYPNFLKRFAALANHMLTMPLDSHAMHALRDQIGFFWQAVVQVRPFNDKLEVYVQPFIGPLVWMLQFIGHKAPEAKGPGMGMGMFALFDQIHVKSDTLEALDKLISGLLAAKKPTRDTFDIMLKHGVLTQLVRVITRALDHNGRLCRFSASITEVEDEEDDEDKRERVDEQNMMMCWRLIGAVCGEEGTKYTEMVLQAGLLPMLSNALKIMHKRSKEHVVETCRNRSARSAKELLFVLTNIAAGERRHIEAVFNTKDLMPMVLWQLQHGRTLSRFEATVVVYNVVHSQHAHLVVPMIDSFENGRVEVIAAVVDLIGSSDLRVQLQAIRTLEMILAFYEKHLKTADAYVHQSWHERAEQADVLSNLAEILNRPDLEDGDDLFLAAKKLAARFESEDDDFGDNESSAQPFVVNAQGAFDFSAGSSHPNVSFDFGSSAGGSGGFGGSGASNGSNGSGGAGSDTWNAMAMLTGSGNNNNSGGFQTANASGMSDFFLSSSSSSSASSSASSSSSMSMSPFQDGKRSGGGATGGSGNGGLWGAGAGAGANGGASSGSGSNGWGTGSWGTGGSNNTNTNTHGSNNSNMSDMTDEPGGATASGASNALVRPGDLFYSNTSVVNPFMNLSQLSQSSTSMINGSMIGGLMTNSNSSGFNAWCSS